MVYYTNNNNKYAISYNIFKIKGTTATWSGLGIEIVYGENTYFRTIRTLGYGKDHFSLLLPQQSSFVSHRNWNLICPLLCWYYNFLHAYTGQQLITLQALAWVWTGWKWAYFTANLYDCFFLVKTAWILVVQGSHFLNNLSANKISKATVQLIKMIDRWEIVLEFYCDLYLIASSPQRQFLDNVPLLERYCRTIFFLP